MVRVTIEEGAYHLSDHLKTLLYWFEPLIINVFSLLVFYLFVDNIILNPLPEVLSVNLRLPPLEFLNHLIKMTQQYATFLS